jgi:FtsH-binding integral membrane protein
MEAFRVLHRSLDRIGRAVGQLTVFVLAISLFIAPMAAMIFGCFFAAFGVEYLTGGGVALTFVLFWLFIGLIGGYVTPHVQPQISAAFIALLKSN